MSLVTRLAGSTQTPDAFYGGNGVTGIVAGGHPDNQAGAVASAPGGGATDFDSETKSARWFNFAAVTGAILAVRLKMTWEVFGSATVNAANDGTGSAGSNSLIEYTINGGGSWVTVVSDGCAATHNPPTSDDYAQSGSLDVSLGASQNLANIQVRDVMSANASAEPGAIQGSDAQADGHIIITNLRVEVTLQDGSVITLM